MDYVKAFLIGGIICAVVQILLDRTKLMPGRVMVFWFVPERCLAFLIFMSHLQNLQVPARRYRLADLGTFCGRALRRR